MYPRYFWTPRMYSRYFGNGKSAKILHNHFFSNLKRLNKKINLDFLKSEKKIDFFKIIFLKISFVLTFDTNDGVQNS